MNIKIMIADDQRLMREGLKMILDLQDDMSVVELAENGRDALDKITAVTPGVRPDLVLMDIRMPVMDGVECTRLIKQQYPGIRVIILTTFDDDEFIIEALKNGAAGYILKDLSADKLIRTVRDVYEGDSIMQPEIAAKVIAHIAGAGAGGSTVSGGPSGAGAGGSIVSGSCRLYPAEAKTYGEREPGCREECGAGPVFAEELTEREKDVLRLVGKGMSNVEISQTLFISEGTVKNYISSLYGKLGINDRSKLTLFAIGKGFS